MSEEAMQDAPDVEVSASDGEVAEVQEVDLSAVPDTVRDHVDVDLYANDADYRQALEHGWTPREVYEASGRDEADYTGYKQFNRRYNDFQTQKKLETKMTEMEKKFSESIDQLIDYHESDKKAAIENAIKQKEALLNEAVADGETEMALELQKELHELKSVPTESKPQEAVEPEVAQNFRAANPIMQPGSPEYNRSFERAVVSAVNEQWAQASNNFTVNLPDTTVQAFFDAAMAQVKKDFGMTDAQPRQQQKSPNVNAPGSKRPAADPVKNLTTTGRQIYDKLLAKRGKAAADSYAQRVGGAQ